MVEKLLKIYLATCENDLNENVLEVPSKDEARPNADENQPDHNGTDTFANISKCSLQCIVLKDNSTSNQMFEHSADTKLPKPCLCVPGGLIIPGPKCIKNRNTNTSQPYDVHKYTEKCKRVPKYVSEARTFETSCGKRQKRTPKELQDSGKIETKLKNHDEWKPFIKLLATDTEPDLPEYTKKFGTEQDVFGANYAGPKVDATARTVRMSKTAGIPGDWPLVGVYSIDTLTYDFGREPMKLSKKLSGSVTFGAVFEGLSKDTFVYGCYSTKSLSDYFKTCPYGCTEPKGKKSKGVQDDDWDELIDGPKYCEYGCPRKEEYWIPPRCIRCAQEMFEEQQAKLLAEKDKRAAEKYAQKEKEKRAAAEAKRKALEAEIEEEKQAAAAALEKKLGPLKAASEKKAAEAEKRAAAEKAAKEKKAAAEKAAEAKRAAEERAAEEREEAKERAAEQKRLEAEQKAREKQAAAEEKKRLAAKLAQEKQIAKEKAAKEKKIAAEKAAKEKKALAEKDAAEKKAFEAVLEARRAAAKEVKAAAMARAAEAAAMREAADKKEEEERKAEQALAKKCCICKDMEGKGQDAKGDTTDQATPPCKCKFDPPDLSNDQGGEPRSQTGGNARTGQTTSKAQNKDFSNESDEDKEVPSYVVRKWADELESVAFDRNQRKKCVPQNCQCDIPWCSGHYKTEITLNLERPAPPCGNPEDGAEGSPIACTEECKFQNMCAKFHAGMTSDMARMRSGFTVNVKQRACTSCDTTKICKEDLCCKDKEKKHICECPGGVSGFRLAQPCQSRPCPRRNTILKKK